MTDSKSKDVVCVLCKYYRPWYEQRGNEKFVVNGRGETLGKCRVRIHRKGKRKGKQKDVHPQTSCGRFRRVGT